MYMKLRESRPYYLQRVPLTSLHCFFTVSVHVFLYLRREVQTLLLGAWNSRLVFRVFGFESRSGHGLIILMGFLAYSDLNMWCSIKFYIFTTPLYKITFLLQYIWIEFLHIPRMIQKRNGNDDGNLKKKYKGFPVHSTKAHRRSRGIPPHVRDLGVRWWSVVNITRRPH